MRKEVFKKLVSVVLAAIMLASMAGCGKETSDKEQSDEAPVTEKPVEGEAGVTFPLENEVSFDIMVVCDRDLDAELAKTPWWQELYEATNVKINWITIPSDGTMTTINAMFTSGQEGDAVLGGGVISDSDLILMASNDLLIPLDEYVDDEDLMPNLNDHVFSELSGARNLLTAPDGHVYSLAKYTSLEGNYLESPIWINKAWIDSLGMELPSTIEELEEILIAFRDNDMNGNGINDDEIPYLFLNGQSFAHMEAILGLWGIATKDSQFDSYVYVEEGKVKFAPVTDAYKEALSTLNDWYEKGLIWSECFVATDETFSAKLSGELPLVGMITSKTPPTTNKGDYVQLTPVKVEGYETRWYFHPGFMGTKGQFSVTRSCENVDILMHWIDLFYTFENSIRSSYGEEEDGRYTTENGKVVFNTLSSEKGEELRNNKPSLRELINNFPSALTTSDYESRIELSGAEAIYQENYALYEEYITDEVWPRPYIASDDATRLSELRTDIFNTVAEKRAAWVTGVSDIDAEWDDYVESLNRMGLEEFVEIYQRAYDVFNDNQN